MPLRPSVRLTEQGEPAELMDAGKEPAIIDNLR
jgi:hypothetical protein